MKKSIVTEDNGYCALCGRPRQCYHHLIFGNGMRREADEDGLTIPICNNCHNMAYFRPEQIHENTMAEKLSKITGQLAWQRWDLATKLAEALNRLGETEGTNELVTARKILEGTDERFLARYGKRFI